MSTHYNPEELIEKYREKPNPELKQEVILAYRNLVEHVAKRFSGIEPIEDLIQVGYIGLLNALNRYKSSSGVRFQTYASHLIAGEIKHYLRDKALAIRHPAWLQELRHRINKFIAQYQALNSALPSEQVIASELGLNLNIISEVLQTQETLKIISLNSLASGNEDEMTTESEQCDLPCFQQESRTFEDRLILENAIDQLRDLEKSVLIYFHFESMSQSEIAKKLDISYNYVSHLLRGALNKLKKILIYGTRHHQDEINNNFSIELAITEQVSGIHNKSHFLNRLQEECHRCSSNKQTFHVTMIKFNGLTSLQQAFGLESLLEFLSEAAEFIKTKTKKADMIALYQLNIFTILHSYPKENIHTEVKALEATLKDWISSRKAPTGQVDLLTECASYPEDASTPNSLINYICTKMNIQNTRSLKQENKTHVA